MNPPAHPVDEPVRVGSRLCTVCHQPILLRRKDAKTCLAHAGVRKDTRKRSKTPEQNRRYKELYFRRFVSIDGEATTKAGDYGLLAASSGAYIQHRAGLSTEECLRWLLALPKNHTAGGGRPIYVGFAIDYDVNQILKDLPLKGERGSIEELRRENVTRWHGYTIRYFHRKIFRVQYGKKSVTWFDTWGYFQSSFESALEKWNIATPEIIKEGKAARGSFHRWSLEKLRQYNNAELETHVQLMNHLREAIQPLNLKVSSWHGPAALAGYWLRKNRVQDLLVPPDEELDEVVRMAYSAGRIDIRGVGVIKPVYHKDIVSAYPSATRHLPNLTLLTWRHAKEIPIDARTYVGHVKWNIDPKAAWGPFFWRDKSGSILYPPKGEGWYWMPELEAATERFGSGAFQVTECYYATGEHEYPLKPLIEDAFAHRAKLKAEGNPSHVPVKLILNSIYGKFAQQVGKAQYHSLIYAGLITSYTRAQIMLSLTDATVLVMTDSVWSEEPFPDASSHELGGWEHASEAQLTIIGAGLYKTVSHDGSEHTWQRGFDKKNPVDVDRIAREWLHGDHGYTPTYSVHRFIGMGLASVTSYPWRAWLDIERTINSVPYWGTSKRDGLDEGEIAANKEDFLRLPMREASDQCSWPYEGRVTDPELAKRLTEERLEDECHDE